MSFNPYVSLAEEAARRIEAAIPANPRIMEMTSAWDLFSVDGLQLNDLGLSLGQASAALAHAKCAFRRRTP